MYTITKRYTFDAAHKLAGLPPSHKCANLHGHTYTVEVALSTTRLDETGFVMDFGDLKPLKDYIDAAFDHKYLNDVLPDNPTSENLARHIYNAIPGLITIPEGRVWIQYVRVSETPNTMAEYSV